MWPRVAAAFGTLIAIGVLVGCGGGDASSSSQARELITYLEQSEKANELWQRGRDVYNDAVNQLPVGTPVSGVQAIRIGALIPESVDLLSEASIKQRLADAPDALDSINEEFAQDMTTLADYWDSIGGALRDVDNVRLNGLLGSGYGTGNAPGGAVRSEWRVAVTAYAREVGVDMPAWTDTIGRVIDDDDASTTPSAATSRASTTDAAEADRAEAARKAKAAKARAQRVTRAARAKAARARQARAQAAARARAAAQARAKAARARARARAAQPAPVPTVYAETDPEFLLGKIDHGIDNGADPRLRQYANAITKLKGACGKNRMRIADRATSIMNTLDERAGVTVTTLEVLQGVGIASEAGVGSCDDIFAMWAVVREGEG